MKTDAFMSFKKALGRESYILPTIGTVDYHGQKFVPLKADEPNHQTNTKFNL